LILLVHGANLPSPPRRAKAGLTFNRQDPIGLLTSVTITHVAELAGVSMKTVSRVLNGERYVREEVRDRVLAAARELRYRPKVSARSLAGRRSFIICNLLSALSPYGVMTQLGALEACRRRQYHLVVETIDFEAPDPESEIETLLASLPMDGMLLLPPVCDDEVILTALDRQEIPYVRVSPGRDRAGGLTVAVNEAAAARQLTDHLLDLGHERIGFICGVEGHLSSRERLKGFKAALAARGVPFDPALVMPGDFIFESGFTAAERFLATASPPTAVFAGNDLSAFGVMAYAQDQGVRVPEALSVVGFDDMAMTAMWRPPLTTMRQPVAEMADFATETLIALAGGAPAPQRSTTFTCELVVRASTAPPPQSGDHPAGARGRPRAAASASRRPR
jgi:LacI family transcriptional regulator